MISEMMMREGGTGSFVSVPRGRGEENRGVHTVMDIKFSSTVAKCE